MTKDHVTQWIDTNTENIFQYLISDIWLLFHQRSMNRAINRIVNHEKSILCFLFFFSFWFFMTLARTLPTDNKTLLVVCLKLMYRKIFFLLTEKQISGHYFNDLHFIQVKNNPRSCEVNLCNCVRSLKKIQDFNGIPYFFLFFFCSCFRHTLRSQLRGSFFTWFHFRSSHIWFISYTFVTLHFIVLLKVSSILL